MSVRRHEREKKMEKIKLMPLKEGEIKSLKRQSVEIREAGLHPQHPGRPQG